MKTIGEQLKEFFGGIWGVCKALAKSRKFVLALVGSLLTLAVAVAPQLASFEGHAINVVDLFIGVVIAGIALEDAALKLKVDAKEG